MALPILLQRAQAPDGGEQREDLGRVERGRKDHLSRSEPDAAQHGIKGISRRVGEAQLGLGVLMGDEIAASELPGLQTVVKSDQMKDQGDEDDSHSRPERRPPQPSPGGLSKG